MSLPFSPLKKNSEELLMPLFSESIAPLGSTVKPSCHSSSLNIGHGASAALFFLPLSFLLRYQSDRTEGMALAVHTADQGSIPIWFPLVLPSVFLNAEPR